jgi:hypothetical protein
MAVNRALLLVALVFFDGFTYGNISYGAFKKGETG